MFWEITSNAIIFSPPPPFVYSFILLPPPAPPLTDHPTLNPTIRNRRAY